MGDTSKKYAIVDIHVKCTKCKRTTRMKFPGLTWVRKTKCPFCGTKSSLLSYIPKCKRYG